MNCNRITSTNQNFANKNRANVSQVYSVKGGFFRSNSVKKYVKKYRKTQSVYASNQIYWNSFFTQFFLLFVYTCGVCVDRLSMHCRWISVRHQWFCECNNPHMLFGLENDLRSHRNHRKWIIRILPSLSYGNSLEYTPYTLFFLPLVRDYRFDL